MTRSNEPEDPPLLQGGGPLHSAGDGWVRFLSRLGTGPEQAQAFVARNFLLDEGIASPRIDSYAEAGAIAEHATVEDWAGVHEDYLADRVFRLPPGDGLPATIDPADEITCPETFRFIDPESPFLVSDPRVHLIRVERLDFIARYGGETVDRAKGWAEAVVNAQDPDAVRSLNDILARWAREIEIRPVFTAFMEDVVHLFGDAPSEDAPGWADDLRDSLGLFHYDPGGRMPVGPQQGLDILVFRYPVSAVPRLVGLERERKPLVPPTVLDGRHSPAFAPAPRGSLTGHVIDLVGKATFPRREVLHPGVPFEAKHLWRVGRIIRPVDPLNLPTARGVHLWLVRRVSGRDDYARGTDGDLL